MRSFIAASTTTKPVVLPWPDFIYSTCVSNNPALAVNDDPFHPQVIDAGPEAGITARHRCPDPMPARLDSAHQSRPRSRVAAQYLGGQNIDKLKNTIERLKQWFCVSDLRADVAIDPVYPQALLRGDSIKG